ncbi:MAG: ATP-binding cassette domain-containing protein [Mycobacterium sp.]|nr:ATP-binding cassette domain-containing protein [Mycobacterium sp.]
MRTDAFAFPLTVFAGSTRYTFSPGREVTVGRDDRADIPLDNPEDNQYTSRIHLVLRFDGRNWLAIDRSRNGMFVDGERVTTVNIRDGNSVTLGDPQQGPRLLFRVGAAAEQAAGPPDRRTRGGPGQPVAPGRQPARGGWRTPLTARPSSSPGPRKWPPSQPTTRSGPPSRSLSEPPTDRVRTSPPAQPPSQPTEAQPPAAAPTSRRPEPSQLPTEPILVAHPSPQPPAPQRPTRPPPPRQPGWAAEQAPVHPPERRAVEQPSPAAQQELRPDIGERRQGADHKSLALAGRVAGALNKLRPRSTAPRPHEEAPTRKLPQTGAGTAAAVAPARPTAPATRGLQAHQLNVAVDGRQVLTEVSFTASPGTLTAVIGPRVACKTALIDTLGGLRQPSSGELILDGHDVNAPSMRSRIGVVPREDVVHRQLTVEQAVGYAAELRLPPDTSGDDRRRAVHRVLTELELDSQRTVQIANLSNEARKRASIAAELVAGPSMLVLDEPTADLDPAQERRTMATLRKLADPGRVVVVATSSLDRLDVFDRVLLLTSRGATAFAGPPAQIEAELGTTDWSEIFDRVSTDPQGAREAFLAREEAPQPPPRPSEAAPEQARLGLWRQIAVAARRQAWVIVGDQRYFIFLTILPILFSAVALLRPGHTGLGEGDPYGAGPDEAVQLLVVLTMAAVVMGTALTIRDLVGERSVFGREQSVGLSPSAYLAAKVLVYSVIAAIQAAIVTTAVVVGKGAPSSSALLLGDSVLELYVSVAATAIVSAIVALALASLAKYQEQLMAMAVLVLLLALVFCGGILPLNGRNALAVVSWLVPARWGMAAAASSIDVERIDLLATRDTLWTHSTGQWLFDLGILIAFGVAGIAFLRWRLRLPARTSHGPHHRGDEPTDQVGRRNGGSPEE